LLFAASAGSLRRLAQKRADQEQGFNREAALTIFETYACQAIRMNGAGVSPKWGFDWWE
jgi:hypothetical protein